MSWRMQNFAYALEPGNRGDTHLILRHLQLTLPLLQLLHGFLLALQLTLLRSYLQTQERIKSEITYS